MQGLPDTQNEPDHREIVIDRVGIRELRYPARYVGADEEQSTVAKYEMTVELPAHLKGTHMSRFVEALHDFKEPLSGASLARLTESLASRLQAERAYIGCEFTIFRKKEAPVSRMESLMDYELGMEYRYSTKEESQLFLSVQIPVATLCPCSKAISERGAHNQRGVVTISVEASTDLTFEELIELAESSASCELYAGLKRSDEKAVTERAYDQPVFVEDLARNVAVKLKSHQGIMWYRVEAENFESIHHHNAYAMIEA
ncbi:GTP cyclohydrolase FolE2 [Luteolibacter sp. AS25]|uniref:GTP cyclohydrolase FolE2 n=1 Tax=Luteolibacter sp. AS25 TaxID=3135776 RepID=UPI00398A5314